jgi:hypothetical protein
MDPGQTLLATFRDKIKMTLNNHYTTNLTIPKAMYRDF